jgi:hypothetical protein
MPGSQRRFVLCCILAIAGAWIAAPAAAAGFCAQGEVSISCGGRTACAIPPAVCCGGAICGDGMVCAQTARGPECGVPRVTRCGQYTCGEGMTCVQTPRGPECGMPTGRALGSVWTESELGWQGTWTRIGRSNQFSAEWTHPSGRREAATMTISVTGNRVSIRRDQGQRGQCRYSGIVSRSGGTRTVNGTYGCDWAQGPFPFSATIQD